MSKKTDIYHSILIVSSSEKFDAIVKKSLTGFVTIDCRKSVALARRCIVERYYDIVVINAPLPDESGLEFAIDVSETMNASVLFISPSEVYEDVLEQITDNGVLSISKGMDSRRVDTAIRYLVAIQDRIHKFEQKTLSLEEKMEDLRLVSKAKILLVEREGMTEDEAHRHIGKLAMDNGVSRRRIAEEILDKY